MPSPEINDVWGNTAPPNLPKLVELPSGQVVKAVRIGVEGLVTAGILGEGDELTKLVDQKHLKGKPDKAIQTALMSDPKAVGAFVSIIDRALLLIVVEPKVHHHLDDKGKMISPEDREPGVYTDQIPFTDKVELMNFGVGGLTDLARFRQQPTDTVAAVADVAVVPVPSERAPRDRPRRKRKS